MSHMRYVISVRFCHRRRRQFETDIWSRTIVILSAALLSTKKNTELSK